MEEGTELAPSCLNWTWPWCYYLGMVDFVDFVGMMLSQSGIWRLKEMDSLRDTAQIRGFDHSPHSAWPCTALHCNSIDRILVQEQRDLGKCGMDSIVKRARTSGVEL